jgi:NADH-quinone oxidoreductase subunit C
MDERGDWMNLEEIFELYFYNIENQVIFLFEKMSKFIILKINFFINVFINYFEIYFLLLLLNKNIFANYKSGVDFTAIDYYFKPRRFKLVYSILNILSNKRINIYSFSNTNNIISSISSIFKSFNWSEREIWDLFGIFFINNNNLRRILNDYGFKGYPLRKDFPLTGFIELYFNNSFLDICYRPVQLSQELRFFNFSSCWYDNASNI